MSKKNQMSAELCQAVTARNYDTIDRALKAGADPTLHVDGERNALELAPDEETLQRLETGFRAKVSATVACYLWILVVLSVLGIIMINIMISNANAEVPKDLATGILVLNAIFALFISYWLFVRNSLRLYALGSGC